MSYEYHLRKKGLNKNTVASYLHSFELFKSWMYDNDLSVENISYNQIMEYIKFCRNNGNKDITIKGKLLVIRYWLDARGIKPNPCAGWYIKTRHNPLPSPLLTELQINKLYHSYPENNALQIRNKCILGMVCYQALDTGDISKLMLTSINRDMEVILVQKKKRSGGRSMRIKDQQKKVLYKYMDKSREKLLRGRNTDHLMFNHGRSSNIMIVYAYLREDLKEMFELFKNYYQIRASVISNWLKHYNLREVQYMAGHKYVSSTERYLVSRIEELQKMVDKIHPMK